MIYNTISNYGLERTTVTYPNVWWDNLFSADEVDRMAVYFANHSTEEAKISTSGVTNKTVRSSEISIHGPNDSTRWIFERLNAGIKAINDQFYGFDLNGYDFIQYGEYQSKNKGKYDWHMDLSLGVKSDPNNFQTRKLSLSMLLNEPGIDFKGGEFQIHHGNPDTITTPESKKGRIIAFPSFIPHRVSPITKGIRKSLVIWVDGPKFK